MNATVTISNTFNLVYFYLHILFQDTKIHCKVGKSSWPQTLRHQKFHMHEHCTYTTAHTLSPSWRNAKPLSLLHALTASFSQPLSLQLYLSLSLSLSIIVWQHLNMTRHAQTSHSERHSITQTLSLNLKVSHFKSILKAYQALISQHRLIR